MKIIIFTILFSLSSFAKIDGIIKVVEAPIFAEPDEFSDVVQYARKGQTIYLHPSVGKEIRYDRLRPTPVSDVELLKNSFQEYKKEFPDPAFEEKFYTYHHTDRFYLTLTNRKRAGYVLKKHVSVLYKDRRELHEEKLIYDPTDYRISEPLPEGYPLKKIGGYKGMFSVGMGGSTRSSYNYPGDKIKDKSEGLLEATVVWSKLVELGDLSRLYFGWLANVNTISKTIIFPTGKATESWKQIGIGPYISYDVWKDLKATWTGYLSFTYNLVNTVSISQVFTGMDSEQAQFSGTSFTAKTGLYYKKRHALGHNIDVTVGTNFNLEPATRMSGNPDSSSGLWAAGSKFSTKFLIDTTLFIGIQSDY